MERIKNRILVALDFEEQSMQALEHSYELARIFDADIILLHVIEGVGILDKLRSPDEYLRNIIEQVNEKFEELDNLASKISYKNLIRVTTMVEKGKPYERITEIARDQNVLLIVMGKQSSSAQLKSRKFLGSNVMSVIREAPCPVVTVHPSENTSTGYKNILLPLDFTKQTKRQVQKAIEIGGYFGSRITILSVLKEDNQVMKILKQVQLNQVRKAFQRNGIQCHTEFVFNEETPLPDIVINYSKKTNADLIIIMTRKKMNILHNDVSSTVQRIISDSEIPVLSIVPSAEFKPGVVTSMIDPMQLINDPKNNQTSRSDKLE